MCLDVCCSVLDPFGEFRISNGRLGFVFVMNSIRWWFKNWSMRLFGGRTASCSEDQTAIRFQNRVISCECLLLPFFSWFTVANIYLCFTFIISSDYLIYFISITTCITLWDISDCSPYLSSWYEHLSASFHMLVFHRCWIRLSIDTP